MTFTTNTLILKHRNELKISFVVPINIEVRKGYAYYTNNLNKNTMVGKLDNWISDIPEEEYPSAISFNIGSEFSFKDFCNELELDKINVI